MTPGQIQVPSPRPISPKQKAELAACLSKTSKARQRVSKGMLSPGVSLGRTATAAQPQ